MLRVSINDLKSRLRDIPGIEALSMQVLAGRQTFSVAGKLIATDLSASIAEVEQAIRSACHSNAIVQMPIAAPGESAQASAALIPSVTLAKPKDSPMPASGGFAASLRAMMDDARAGVEQARSEGIAKVGDAVKKLHDAKTAITHVTGNMTKTIEDEAASVMSELGQIANDFGGEGSVGRPSDYSPELVATICSRISAGESLRSVCRDETMPDKSTVFVWLAKHKDFQDQYARATAARADAFAEEIVDIADDGSNDTYADEDGNERTNTDVIQRSKLRVDTRKWLMARMAPKKYGDRIEQIQTGDPDKPITTVTRIERVIAQAPSRE